MNPPDWSCPESKSTVEIFILFSVFSFLFSPSLLLPEEESFLDPGQNCYVIQPPRRQGNRRAEISSPRLPPPLPPPQTSKQKIQDFHFSPRIGLLRHPQPKQDDSIGLNGRPSQKTYGVPSVSDCPSGDFLLLLPFL